MEVISTDEACFDNLRVVDREVVHFGTEFVERFLIVKNDQLFFMKVALVFSQAKILTLFAFYLTANCLNTVLYS